MMIVMQGGGQAACCFGLRVCSSKQAVITQCASCN
jgi:hypothetical protein